MMGLGCVSLLGGQMNEKAEFYYVPFMLLVLIIFTLSKLLIPKTLGKCLNAESIPRRRIPLNPIKTLIFPPSCENDESGEERDP